MQRKGTRSETGALSSVAISVPAIGGLYRPTRYAAHTNRCSYRYPRDSRGCPAADARWYDSTVSYAGCAGRRGLSSAAGSHAAAADHRSAARCTGNQSAALVVCIVRAARIIGRCARPSRACPRCCAAGRARAQPHSAPVAHPDRNSYRHSHTHRDANAYAASHAHRDANAYAAPDAHTTRRSSACRHSSTRCRCTERYAGRCRAAYPYPQPGCRRRIAAARRLAHARADTHPYSDAHPCTDAHRHADAHTRP